MLGMLWNCRGSIGLASESINEKRLEKESRMECLGGKKYQPFKNFSYFLLTNRNKCDTMHNTNHIPI